MENSTAALARSITRASSRQTYYTARLLVDRDLVDDFCRAYAYFRWADDIVDEPRSCDTAGGASAGSDEKRMSFIRRQRDLIDRLFREERPDDLAPEEEILADLIKHDRGENSGLQSFIRYMFAVVEFDAHRRGQLISQQELERYSDWLTKSATDGLLYFIGHGHPYPETDNRYLAAHAAHITHLLRDMVQDTADGFINIPREYLASCGINAADMDSAPFRAWVRDRVELARRYFCHGKRYLDELDVLRRKIAGYWYCARFEGVLDTIEQDGYVLRAAYDRRHKLFAWLRMAWLAASISVRHIANQTPSDSWRNGPQCDCEGSDHTALGEIP
jgi:phytoene/squalene synthetase